MATYAKNLVGADTLRRTTYKEFPLGTVEYAAGNKKLIYVVASGSVAVGTCTVADTTFVCTDTGGDWTADAVFASGEYGWVWKVDHAFA